MKTTSKKKRRRFVTVRLEPCDRELIKRLGKNHKDRHAMLRELAQTVRTLGLQPRRLVPIKLGIPAELDAEIKKIVATTGRRFTEVLLAALHDCEARPTAKGIVKAGYRLMLGSAKVLIYDRCDRLVAEKHIRHRLDLDTAIAQFKADPKALIANLRREAS